MLLKDIQDVKLTQQQKQVNVRQINTEAKPTIMQLLELVSCFIH